MNKYFCEIWSILKIKLVKCKISADMHSKKRKNWDIFLPFKQFSLAGHLSASRIMLILLCQPEKCMTWVLDHPQEQDELPSFLLFLYSISSAFFKLHDFSLIRCSKSKEMESGYTWDTTEFVWIIFMLTIGRQTWIQGRIYDIFLGNRREAVTEDWILLCRHL